MFRLSAFRDALVAHYTPPRSRSSSPPSTHVVPSQYNSVVLQMLGASTPSAENAEQLADISISRPRTRLSWGIPVPTDPQHTVYVWFDALLIYLSGVGYPWSAPASSSSPPPSQATAVQEEREAGWPADLQIIGKDILRFHAIYLPAILLALSGPSYSSLSSSPTPRSLPNPATTSTPQLPTRLLTHAHWTVSSAKMSKSVGNVVDPLSAMQTYSVDVVRWYMARVGGRFRDDVDWSAEQLEKHGKELQSLVGNYLLRVVSEKIAKAAERGRVGSGEAEGPYVFQHEANAELVREVGALPRKVGECMERLEVAEAVEGVVDVLKLVRISLSFSSCISIHIPAFSHFHAPPARRLFSIPYPSPSFTVPVLALTPSLDLALDLASSSHPPSSCFLRSGILMLTPFPPSRQTKPYQTSHPGPKHAPHPSSTRRAKPPCLRCVLRVCVSGRLCLRRVGGCCRHWVAMIIVQENGRV